MSGNRRYRPPLLAIAATLSLASCTSLQDAAPQDASATMTGGQHGGRSASGNGPAPTSSDMDMRAMCAAHGHKGHAAGGPHGAPAERHMEAMTPEMRRRHMDMMRQFCK